MFPLVHYFVNSKIYENVPDLMAIGGIFPDLAASAGMDRNFAHNMGREFYRWCIQNAQEAIPLARGIISHGTDPHCVDYYADEYWPGYRKGWCFMQGEAYMAEVARVTRLPEDLIWWKGHNFVEISYELLTDEKYPELRPRLLESISSKDAIDLASETLAAYSGLPEEDFRRVILNVPNIFALTEMTPLTLAEKQNIAFIHRHKVTDADVPGMAELFCRIRDAMRPGYDTYFTKVIKETATILLGY